MNDPGKCTITQLDQNAYRITGPREQIADMLDELPTLSVVLDLDGEAYQKDDTGRWLCAFDPYRIYYTSKQITEISVTVLADINTVKYCPRQT